MECRWVWDEWVGAGVVICYRRIWVEVILCMGVRVWVGVRDVGIPAVWFH